MAAAAAIVARSGAGNPHPERLPPRVLPSNTLGRRLARLGLHPWPTAEGLVEPISAAAALGMEQQLIYLTAYAPPARSLDVPALDLPALADALLRAGEIGPNEAITLRQHQLRVAQDAPVLPRGAAIVTNTLTLIAIQQAGALDALLGYCGQIHLLERDWESLCNLVSDAAVRERALEDLDRLQALIAQAINAAFFHTEVLPQDGQLFQAPVEDDADEPEDAPLHRLVLRYSDEVFRWELERLLVCE